MLSTFPMTVSNTLQSSISFFGNIISTTRTLVQTIRRHPGTALIMLTALQSVVTQAQNLVATIPGDGILHNATLIPNNLGIDNTGVMFYGNNQSYINDSTYAILPKSNYLSVSFWSRLASTGSIVQFNDFSLGVNPDSVMSPDDSTPCPIDFLQVTIGGFAVCGIPAPFTSAIPNNSLIIRDWTHYAVSINQNIMFFYQNGSLVNYADTSPNINASPLPQQFGSSILIGANSFNGQLANFLLYSYALCQQQMVALYQAQLRSQNFNNQSQLSNTICGLGNNLMLSYPGNNTSYFSLTTANVANATNRFGVNNAALRFNGDGYVTGNSYDLPFFGNQTISWWMRNATAGYVFQYTGVDLLINVEYFTNQSGTNYACPGETGYLSINFGGNLICGGWRDSPLNQNQYIGAGTISWTQYAITINYPNSATIYINGSALPQNNPPYSEPYQASGEPAFVIANEFVGEIDTLKVYATQLSAAQIAANFLAEITSTDVLPASSSTGLASLSSSSSRIISSAISSTLATSSTRSSSSSSISTTSNRVNTALSSSSSSSNPLTSSFSLSSTPSSTSLSGMPTSTKTAGWSSSTSPASSSSFAMSSSSSTPRSSLTSQLSSSAPISLTASSADQDSSGSSFPLFAKIVLPIGVAALAACGGLTFFAVKRHRAQHASQQLDRTHSSSFSAVEMPRV